MTRELKNKGFNTPFTQLKKRRASRAPQPPPAAGAVRQVQPPPPAAKAAALSPDTEATGLSPDADAQLFLRAIAGTVPLRASVPRQAPDPTVERVRLSDDDLALAELRDLVQGHGTFQVHESEEMLCGLAPGVNLQLLHQLQEGHFAYHRYIDLHGLGRQDAHLAVNRFVMTCRRDAERCILIITGHGKSSPDGLSVLRSSLPRWLSRSPCRPHVLAFCTAQSVDGGSGAFYVLLRRPGIKPFGIGALP